MARTLYMNGTILTVDARDGTAEAVLEEDGRIAAVGALADLEPAAGAGARRRDLRGRTMIPAFIDPHGHFPDSGFLALHRADLAGPPIGSCRSIADVLARLEAKAASTPPGEWVIGSGFEPTGLAENRFPTRAELDGVSREHPVWVVHVSGHAGAANSIALESRGVAEDAVDPPGGRFGRDAAGRLDGLLEGMAAMGDLGDTEFQIDYERFRSAFAAAAREYLGEGVAMAQNAWATPVLLDYFCRIAAAPDPALEVMVLPAGFLEPGLSRGERGLALPSQGPILFGPRKLFGDGSFHLQTACMTTPYYRPLNGDPAWCCPLAVTVEQMTGRIGTLHDLGFQVHIHANGDATADVMLDAIERVLDRNPRADHRHTLIHAQALREDQLDRMAALGVSVSFFPAHLYYWGEFHRDVTFGPDRVGDMCPTRWAAERGVRFTIHNDAQVTPTRPLHLMGCAVNRTSVTGTRIGPAQALTPREALRAHTIDAAWQVFQDHERGSIEPGKRADFAILSDNPLDNPARLADIAVEETIVRGRTAFSASSEAP